MVGAARCWSWMFEEKVDVDRFSMGGSCRAARLSSRCLRELVVASVVALAAPLRSQL